MLLLDNKAILILLCSTNIEYCSLTLSAPIPSKEKKINLNFYFHTSLWYLKGFYEGLKDLHKTF